MTMTSTVGGFTPFLFWSLFVFSFGGGGGLCPFILSCILSSGPVSFRPVFHPVVWCCILSSGPVHTYVSFSFWAWGEKSLQILLLSYNSVLYSLHLTCVCTVCTCCT